MNRKYFKVQFLLISLINFVFSIISLGLLIRFTFRLFGANPSSDIVDFIYTSTSPLLDPFRGIFRPDIIDSSSVFEYSSLIAIVFYLLLSWILAELINLFSLYRDRYQGQN